MTRLLVTAVALFAGAGLLAQDARQATRAAIAGTVFDERGQPMPGVRVVAEPVSPDLEAVGPFRGPEVLRRFARTDGRGQYTFDDLVPDEYFVHAGGLGSTVFLSPSTCGYPALGPEWVPPVSGLVDRDDRHQLLLSSGLTPPAEGTGSPDIVYARTFAPATTNRDEARRVSVSETSRSEGIDITMQLRSAGRIEGTLVDAAGLPHEMDVVAETDAGTTLTRSNAASRFLLMAVPAGSARVRATGTYSDCDFSHGRQDGAWTAEVDVAVPPGGTAANVRLVLAATSEHAGRYRGADPWTLERGSGSISGVVRDVAGMPLARARVWLGNPGLPIGRTYLTGPSGRFLFDRLPGGPYLLRVSRHGYTNAARAGSLTLESGEHATADLEMRPENVPQRRSPGVP